MALVMHLNKSGSGFSSMTACGRNLLRTPLSTDWEGFKFEHSQYRCVKCEESKQFALNTRRDLDKWVPVEDENAWMAADDALIAKRKAK